MTAAKCRQPPRTCTAQRRQALPRSACPTRPEAKRKTLTHSSGAPLIHDIEHGRIAIMKTPVLIASGIILPTFATVSAPAQAKTMKECAAQWKEMKEKD